MESQKTETVVLVAHGGRQSGAWSNSRIKTITEANKDLSFDEAIKYMKEGGRALFPSTSFGYFQGLSNDDCQKLFGKAIKDGGIQDPGKRLGQRPDGPRILALRQQKLSFAELGVIALQKKYDTVIVLACRS